MLANNDGGGDVADVFVFLEMLPCFTDVGNDVTDATS